MGAYGKERLILTEPFGPPTTVVDLGMAIDKDGNKITVAGAEVPAIALDDFTQADIDANAANPTIKKKLTGVTLGTCKTLLGVGGCAAGDKLAVETATGKFIVAVAGQYVAAIAREAGVAGDLIEAFKVPTRRGVASADYGALTHAVGTADGTVADVGGAFNQGTLNDNFKEITTKLASIRTVLQAHGLML
jgi:hypothetical protein